MYLPFHNPFIHIPGPGGLVVGRSCFFLRLSGPSGPSMGGAGGLIDRGLTVISTDM